MYHAGKVAQKSATIISDCHWLIGATGRSQNGQAISIASSAGATTNRLKFGQMNM